MSAITDTRRQRLLDEIAKLQQQMDSANADQRKLESKSATPDMRTKQRQEQWALCQLQRADLDKKIRILRGKLAQIDRPAHDAKQQWRAQMTQRIEQQIAWREVLSISLRTHQASHLAVWGNTLETQTANIEEAERRLRECDEGIRQMKQELAFKEESP